MVTYAEMNSVAAQQYGNQYQQAHGGLSSYGLPEDAPEYERALEMLRALPLNKDERAAIISIVNTAMQRSSRQV